MRPRRDDREWGRDDDGDGLREVPCHTREGFWAGLRNVLRPFRGISKWYLGGYVAFYAALHHYSALPALVLRVLLGPSPKTAHEPDSLCLERGGRADAQQPPGRRPRRLRRRLVVLVVLVALASAACSDAPARAADVGASAPAATGPSIKSGARFGKVVMG